MSVNKVDNFAFAEAAYLYHNRKIPYTQLDCQAFVERVLADCGIYKNWKGSNDMWRNALSWKGTIDEAIAKFGSVPVGAWLFTWADDGGEVKRGYKDGLGNAKHVGIFTAKGKGAMHSSTGGVQECPFPDPNRWTHCGLSIYIDYDHVPAAAEDVMSILDDMLKLCDSMIEKINKLKGLTIV